MTTETTTEATTATDTVSVFNSQAIAYAIDAASAFVSTDRTRPILCAIYVEVWVGEDPTLKFTATDSFGLVSTVVGPDEPAGPASFTVLVDPQKGELKKALGKGVGMLTIDVDGIHLEDRKFSSVEGGYPQYRQLVPEASDDPCGRFALGSHTLKPLATLSTVAGKRASHKNHPIRVTGGATNLKPVRLDVSVRCKDGSEATTVGLAMPIRID